MNRHIKEIQLRNKRVENDKAWEISKTRRAIIFIMTYIFVVFFLLQIGAPSPYLNAFIPAFGFLFSTLTLPFLKKIWMKKFGK